MSIDFAAALALDRRLLALEEQAEREAWESARKQGVKALEAEGLALRGLLAREDESGFLGRVVVRFDRTHGEAQGGYRLSAGDPVIVRQQNAEGHGIKAVVRRITPRAAELVFDEAEDWVFDELVTCELGPNDVTFQRLCDGIKVLEGASGEARLLRDVVLGGPAEGRRWQTAPVPIASDEENVAQAEALAAIAARPPVFLLHGPPGTGKTTVLARAIAAAVARDERVLVGAPSNQAIDNLANAALSHGVAVLRLGHPARMDPALYAHTLEGKLETHPQQAVARELFRQARLLFRESRQKNKQGRGLHASAQAHELRTQAKQLLGEAKELERAALAHILDSTPVICATLTGLRDDVLGERGFDLGVIDEATQAMRPAIYPLLARVGRLVLAGDHHQLGPTVISVAAAKAGLARSAFEALIDRPAAPPSRMLTIQYRMHQAIMDYPSRALYGGALVAHASAKARGLDGVVEGGAFAPLTFVDTAGRGFDDEREGDATSYHNSGEVDLALVIAERLVASGVTASDIGVLSPYAAQVQQLRLVGADAGYEINSIDGFQGREKEVIIVSLVRSNSSREIGFLSDVRRMNVALTRARRALIVIGDSATITSHAYYTGFVDHAIATGAHKSAWEFT